MYAVVSLVNGKKCTARQCADRIDQLKLVIVVA